MDEESKAPDTTDDAPSVEALQKQLAELKESAAQIDKWKAANEAKLSEADKLIAERNEAKEKQRTALEEGKEYQKLAEEYKAEALELRKQAESIPELTTYKEKYTALETKLRADLLEQIPEEQRESFKDDSVETLQKVVSLIPNTKPVHKPGGGNKPEGGGGDKMFDQYTPDEQRKYMNEHGDAAWILKVSHDMLTKQKKD